MRTDAEVREWLADLDTYIAASREQGISLASAKDTLKWVLNDAPERRSIRPNGENA